MATTDTTAQIYPIVSFLTSFKFGGFWDKNEPPNNAIEATFGVNEVYRGYIANHSDLTFGLVFLSTIMVKTIQ